MTNILTEGFSQFVDSCRNKFFTIIFRAFLVESSHIFHHSQLVEKQSNRKDITFINIMFSKPRVSIHNMSFPKNRRQVLRSAPDSCCGCIASVLFQLEKVFRLTKINNLDMSIWKQEQICRFKISVAQPNTLHVGQCAHERHYHSFHFILLPKESHLLSFAEDILQVGFMLDVFAHNADSESIVHCFVEKVTVELNHVGMILSLKQLYCFFFVLIQLIQTFCFYLFQCIVFA